MGHIFVFSLSDKFGFEMNDKGHWLIFEYRMKDGDWKLYHAYLDASEQDPFKRGADSTVKYN